MIFYNNLDTRRCSEIKRFWQHIMPLSSIKTVSNSAIILVEDNEVVSDNSKVAEVMNFSDVVDILNIERHYGTEVILQTNDRIFDIGNKYKNHPSFIKIRENISEGSTLEFHYVLKTEIEAYILSIIENFEMKL